ncbi:tetratricopeptide repeat protein [Pseudoalteromonas sp. SSDWG2]|uniref:tetratricopeptide repeat protein n=1 Tax=Pseudoalteromonas sp. SSDWG2 TaxID=3139391 RepID=UPI003BABB02B
MNNNRLTLLLAFVAAITVGPCNSVSAKQVCESCHSEQVQQWQNSHHHKAMNDATEEFVQGVFEGQQITYQDQTLTLSKKDNTYILTTSSQDVEKQQVIKYTFGFMPLQQYLVEDERGGYQFIPLAWDSRPAQEGGQRWFVLHPDQAPHDEFHHSQMGQNWNHMCADCHSTDFKKNYDLESNQFSSLSEHINVSCSACHGNTKQHLAWAAGNTAIKNKGFVKNISTQVTLFTQQRDGSMVAVGEKTSSEQLQVCATCHSRRAQIAPRNDTQAFLDMFRPSLLTPELYHVDGQIYDEDYVWGSFLQSKMFSAGVTCSNCHNPHSGKLKQTGNQTCTQCHGATQFDNTQHHGHRQGSLGSQCVDCHMPETTFMQVDPRRDHSLRVPRPDLTIQTQAPNACNTCHDDKTPQWAVNAIKSWHPQSTRMGSEHFSQAFHAADQGLPTASQLLTRIAQSSQYTDIIRASALVRMGSYPDQNTLVAISRAVRDDEPLKRLGAISAAQGFSPAQRYRLLHLLLSDPRLAVRTEAARSLASMLTVPFPDNLKGEERQTLEKALEEYKQTERFNAERGSSHTNLGNLALELGQSNDAKAHYKQSIKVEPIYIPAYVNLADLYRRLGDEQQAQKVLLQALEVDANNADVHYVLAMSWVRQKDREKAKAHLNIAAKYGSVNHIYTYGLLLNEMGENHAALTQLEKAFSLNPNNPDLCYTLVQLSIGQQDYGQALRFASKLQQLVPNDPQILALVQKLTMMQSVSGN